MIRVVKKNGIPIIEIKGDLRDKQSFELNQKIKKVQEKYQGTIVLDLCGVGFMDSSALGILAFTCKTLDINNQTIVLMNPTEIVKKLLEETNLTKILRVIETFEEL